MSHGVKYLNWRGGRPRWVPGSNLRAKGFKGRDCKYPDGSWMNFADAKALSMELNLSAGVNPLKSLSEKSLSAHVGYVYFIFVSSGKVKIGFSKNPHSRIRSLQTAIESEIRSIMIVPGTLHEEQELHAQFFTERIRGEWFEATQRIVNVALNSALAGRVLISAVAFPVRAKSA